MLKERDVVNGNLDAQNDPKLIVHLDTDWSHTMLDPSSQDANIKIVSHFAFVISVELMSKESGDVLRFDGVNKSFEQMRIDCLENFSFLDDSVVTMKSI